MPSASGPAGVRLLSWTKYRDDLLGTNTLNQGPINTGSRFPADVLYETSSTEFRVAPYWESPGYNDHFRGGLGGEATPCLRPKVKACFSSRHLSASSSPLTRPGFR
jgi:hypothetical protein